MAVTMLPMRLAYGEALLVLGHANPNVEKPCQVSRPLADAQQIFNTDSPPA